MKFSIRDLLLLTVVAALSLGWWVDRSRLVESNLRLSKELKQLHEHLALSQDQIEQQRRRGDYFQYMNDAWKGKPSGAQ